MGGLALAIDMAYPAFYRIGYNAGTGEFWIAYDLGLTPEKPQARLRFCRFHFAPDWGFRAALHAYHRLFPEAFRRRIDRQGLWMPFAKISQIKGWEDFGFQFKEGDDETAWDDAHGIFTFHYTEPLTWWMMANATPDRLCWLTPMLDVLGTETDWNPRGKWRTMDDAHLLYRRALCKGKPFCFLMNSAFEDFSHDLVARYMKRALAYGCFPGFFSHNASEGHYFTRPELYERDRDLFRKYVPLCKVVAEAGWEPITGARSGDEHVHIERFGDQGTRYLTVFNDSPERRDTTITLSLKASETSRELVRGKRVSWTSGKTTVALDPEDMAVLELRP